MFLLSAFALAFVATLFLTTWLAGVLARIGFPLPRERGRIGCLDGLRGYLSVSVLAHHFFIWTQVTQPGGQWAPPTTVVNQLGAGSVALFFMVTGLVFYPYVLSGVRSTPWLAVLVTRLFRIVPLVALSVAVVVAVIALRTGRVPHWPDIVVAARWISCWSEPALMEYPDSGRVNAYVLWSLRYEWLFYLAVLPATAVLMDIVRRRCATWLLPVVLLCGALGMDLLLRQPGREQGGTAYLPLFFVGMLGFECQARHRVAAWLSRPRVGWLAALGLACAMVQFSFPYGAALPAFALFFICIACGNSFGGVLRKPGALVLGECSFGIYLLHGILLDVTFVDVSWIVRALPVAAVPLLLPPVAGLAVLLTAVTYRLVERPAIMVGRMVARQARQRPLRLHGRGQRLAP